MPDPDPDEKECWRCRMMEKMFIEADYWYAGDNGVPQYVCYGCAEMALVAGYPTKKIVEVGDIRI